MGSKTMKVGGERVKMGPGRVKMGSEEVTAGSERARLLLVLPVRLRVHERVFVFLWFWGGVGCRWWRPLRFLQLCVG